jgi:hypothetical protein
MSKKITQEEAKIKTSNTLQYGYLGKMIGEYKGNSIKIEFECQKCFNIFLRQPHHLWKDTLEKENRKDKAIKKAGYKLLRIRSGGLDIPTEKQLRKILLNDFQHGCKKKTITMKSWKLAKEKHKSELK